MQKFLFLLISLLSTPTSLGCYVNKESGLLCSHNGYCDRQVCKCWEGYEGPACEYRTCPKGKAWSDYAIGPDNAHNLSVCSGRGTCDTNTGQCICLPNFEGVACDKLRCPGAPLCGGHGRCLSQEDNSLNIYGMQYSHWDKDMIFGCVCDEGWFGSDCLLRICPTGDDKMTTGQVNEKQLIKCDGDMDPSAETYFYVGFMGEWTRKIYFKDTKDEFTKKLEELKTIGSVGVVFKNTEMHQICSHDDPNGFGASQEAQIAEIEFTEQYGDLPPLRVIVPEGGPIVEVACDTQNEWSQCTSTTLDIKGQSGNTQTSSAVMGTKEESQCAGRGTCDYTTGICTCFYPFISYGTRGDCGDTQTGISPYDCPGETRCSGHGQCSDSPQYVCTCQNGWTSASCHERTCPQGPAWFGAPEGVDNSHRQMECSNRGICDITTGTCSCFDGFEGDACQTMACAVSEDNSELGMCSGHGTCLTMKDVAKFSDNNGDLIENASYGLVPNNESTWDFDQIKHCHCDAGYTGIGCADRECPRTDDINTLGENEVQKITCGTQSSRGCFSEESGKRLGNSDLVVGSEINTSSLATSTGDLYDTLYAALHGCHSNSSCTGVLKARHGVYQNSSWTENPRVNGVYEYKYGLRTNPPSETNTLIDSAGQTSYVLEDCKFKLTFRQQSTPFFTKTSTAQNVIDEFNKLSTVVTDGVKISVHTTNDKLCPEEAISSFSLTFERDYGDLPDVKFEGSKFGWVSIRDSNFVNSTSVLVEETTKGTKENVICGNHGLCDYTTGECDCAVGYAASDGAGKKGNIRDCGYRLPTVGGGGGEGE